MFRFSCITPSISIQSSLGLLEKGIGIPFDTLTGLLPMNATSWPRFDALIADFSILQSGKP
jgi:hypothetical protein